jgi:16S rRNA (guanine(527)-N(7))-methyltransferase RsmG
MKIKQLPAERIWARLKSEQKLTEEQLEKFQKYEAYLSEKNKEFNLTAITDLGGIVRQHFEDSMELRHHIDLSTIKTIADIGTGAGFPAIPLKIMYPHLNVVLLEVTKKKQQFLQEVINLLELENVTICDLDWRTFLRITQESVDLFVTRAALDDLELIRAYRSACFYKNIPIVYWAAELWQAHKRSESFIRRIESYDLGQKKRRLVFFGVEVNGQATLQQD